MIIFSPHLLLLIHLSKINIKLRFFFCFFFNYYCYITFSASKILVSNLTLSTQVWPTKSTGWPWWSSVSTDLTAAVCHCNNSFPVIFILFWGIFICRFLLKNTRVFELFFSLHVLALSKYNLLTIFTLFYYYWILSYLFVILSDLFFMLFWH